jgi:hypothetical protein
MVALDKTLAQPGVAVGAQVVDGKHLALDAEQGKVQPMGSHGYARTFKQIGLGRHIGPFVHDHTG